MDKRDVDFLIEFSRLDYADIERLETIVFELTGETINNREKMKEIWNDVTAPSKEGEKQKDWEEIGSDYIMEQWASDLREDLRGIAEDLQAGQELIGEDDNTSYLFEELEGILNKLKT